MFQVYHNNQICKAAFYQNEKALLRQAQKGWYKQKERSHSPEWERSL